MEDMRKFLLRVIGPVVAGVVTWLGSKGITLDPEFSEAATTAVLLLAMGVVTVAVNWAVGLFGPVGKHREE